MKINEVAKLTGITVRTLHYYDEIGLLKPSEITESGYRLYNEEALERLQQILFFKELDFPLTEIKAIMTDPSYNQVEALYSHKALLIQKRKRLDGLIDLVNLTLKGECTMDFKAFDTTQIEADKKKYAKEVKTRWGNTQAYVESQERTSHYDQTKWKCLQGEGDALLKAFSENRTGDPEGESTQALVKKWQDYITEHFYNCTLEILAGLGLMYVGDERFAKNIDRNGVGTAAFMAKAIESYCAKGTETDELL
ncbi:MAG: MerR family transcriptional regulator [Niameybacter sp.]|uniref:MerR family transcriptional regulator n=1 Tax=Niameybacter sp. TaxID=2033640 RepID=UPI002FC72A2C